MPSARKQLLYNALAGDTQQDLQQDNVRAACLVDTVMCRVCLSGLGRIRDVEIQCSYESLLCSWSAPVLRDQLNQSTTLKTGVPWVLLSLRLCVLLHSDHTRNVIVVCNFCFARRNAKPKCKHRQE